MMVDNERKKILKDAISNFTPTQKYTFTGDKNIDPSYNVAMQLFLAKKGKAYADPNNLRSKLDEMNAEVGLIAYVSGLVSAVTTEQQWSTLFGENTIIHSPENAGSFGYTTQGFTYAPHVIASSLVIPTELEGLVRGVQLTTQTQGLP